MHTCVGYYVPAHTLPKVLRAMTDASGVRVPFRRACSLTAARACQVRFASVRSLLKSRMARALGWLSVGVITLSSRLRSIIGRCRGKADDATPPIRDLFHALRFVLFARCIYACANFSPTLV